MRCEENPEPGEAKGPRSELEFISSARFRFALKLSLAGRTGVWPNRAAVKSTWREKSELKQEKDGRYRRETEREV